MLANASIHGSTWVSVWHHSTERYLPWMLTFVSMTEEEFRPKFLLPEAVTMHERFMAMGLSIGRLSGLLHRSTV